MKVYLAGAIRGCTDEECKGWREKAKALLVGCEILDPMARDYRGREMYNVRAIVEGDLKDIGDSDVLLVNANRDSWGTPMEVVYASRIMGKRVVAFSAKIPSPWLVYHAEIFPTMEEACEAILHG